MMYESKNEPRRGITSRQAYFNTRGHALETNEEAEKAVLENINILLKSENEYDRRDNYEMETKALKRQGQQNLDAAYHKDMPTLEDLTAFE